MAIKFKAKKKSFKIVKSDLFKEQEKHLPKNVKKELGEVLNKIAENPTDVENSMSLFGEPSPEELKNWMSGIKVETVDLVLEYLNDKGCLREKGSKLAHDFWEKYIEEKDEPVEVQER